jgi:hypothetical protein
VSESAGEDVAVGPAFKPTLNVSFVSGVLCLLERAYQSRETGTTEREWGRVSLSPRRNSLLTVSDSETTGQGVALGVGVGLALGVAVGVAIDNIGLGIGVGMALGAALGLVWDQQEA